MLQDVNHSTAKTKNQRVSLDLQRGSEINRKHFGIKFYGLMRPRLTTTKVMERPKSGERGALLMFPNIQAVF